MSARDQALRKAFLASFLGLDGSFLITTGMLRDFEATLSAAGWVVVPAEPTQHMVNRGLERADIDWRAASEDEALSDDEARRIYRAMIAAAFPAAPQEDSDDA